jgi:hypothetical protein
MGTAHGVRPSGTELVTSGLILTQVAGVVTITLGHSLLVIILLLLPLMELKTVLL